MLFGALVVLFVIVCILLCLVVLIQSDKGGGISGALGGGLSNASALLGTQDTANILTRATTILATAYMVLCIVISLFVAGAASRSGGKSMLQERAEKYEAPASILQGGGIQLEDDAEAAEGAGTGEGGLQLEGTGDSKGTGTAGGLQLGEEILPQEQGSSGGENTPSGTADTE